MKFQEWMQKDMKVHTIYCEDPWFSKIEQGLKKVEGRKGIPKHRAIRPGDRIEFLCTQDNRSFSALVEKVESFKTLDDYLQTVGVSRALPGVTTLEQAREIYLQWSTLEEIQRVGFLAIWISVLPNVEKQDKRISPSPK